ncbi:MAG: acyl-CoA dehydrogenase family protein [Tepidiformaceae bacterium]
MGDVSVADDELVAPAIALQPLVRECADEAEAARTLPRRVVTAMAEAGLFHTCVARSCGGFEARPTTAIRVIEAISEADGAAGWTLMIGIESLGLASGAMPTETAAMLIGPTTTMAGALNPLGRARRVPGGWRVDGRWPFASGCCHADYYTAGCLLDDEDGEPIRAGDDGAPAGVIAALAGTRTSREMYVPAGEFEILDTWSVAGLRGSGSHDVAVHDVFVPHERTSSILFEPAVEQGTLFRMPVFSRLAYNKVGVATGIARAAINHFVALANEKRPVGSRDLLRERASAQAALARAEWLLESGRAAVFAIAEAMWDAVEAGEPVTLEQRARLRLACSSAVGAATEAVDMVHTAGGASVNYTRSPLERCFRDVHVVPQHIMVTPQVGEAAGRVFLGMDPGMVTL